MILGTARGIGTHRNDLSRRPLFSELHDVSIISRSALMTMRTTLDFVYVEDVGPEINVTICRGLLRSTPGIDPLFSQITISRADFGSDEF
jgi:hypothetical protein